MNATRNKGGKGGDKEGMDEGGKIKPALAHANLHLTQGLL